MKKKRILVIVAFVLLLALSAFLFDQFRWRPLQQVLEADQWARLESVRAYGEANQSYELELTLENVKDAVFGRLAQKRDKGHSLPAPTVWVWVETVDGSRIEYGFSHDGIVLVNTRFDDRPCPTWKTDYTVYEALTDER